MFKDKVLLITGGTGSFGNAVLERFLNSDLKEIRIFSRDEKKQEDMRIKYKNDKIYYIDKDYLKMYSDKTGIKTILKNSELKFNKNLEFYIY